MILLKSQSSFSARNRAPSSRGALPVKALARVLEYMHANLAADIGLKELATLAGYSPQHFKRAFKISKGLPPHQFLLVSRIERAKELLRQPNNTIAGVALACGFSSQPHLTSVFRRLTGITPGRWVREALR
jgi:AraC family transcriptional regulator